MKTLLTITLLLLLLACNKNKNNTPTNTTELTLIFSDEFNGTTLDMTNWKFENGQSGWGNNELQNYTASGNVEVSNGTLKIIAKKTGVAQQVGNYTSARLNSIKAFEYGQYEIRAKLPPSLGNGLWPAIWMLGNDVAAVDWPKCGEIDIMEYVSFDPHKIYCALHSNANNWTLNNTLSSGPIALANAENVFHNYGILWTENNLKFYIDAPTNIVYAVNKPTNPTNNNWPYSKPFFFLLNMAVGGNWGGTNGINDAIFPATFEIDYVRVYKL